MKKKKELKNFTECDIQMFHFYKPMALTEADPDRSLQTTEQE